MDSICVTSNSVYAKYINRYELINETEAILHITDDNLVDVAIHIDRDVIDRLMKYFWSFCYGGKARTSLQVYAYGEVICYNGYKRRSRVFLKSYILGMNGIEKGHKIICKNRDLCDYRKENLVYQSVSGACKRIAPKKGKRGDLPNGIFEMRRTDGSASGYLFYENGKCHYFGLQKYDTLDNCKYAAISEWHQINTMEQKICG